MSNSSQTNRRNFLKKTSLAGIAALSAPQLILTAATAPKAKKINLNSNDIILFQGDSITDAGRDRKNMSFNHPAALGSGYAYLAAADLLYKHPSKNFKIYNKGISGNKVYQLAERWDSDCLELKPNILSILIGVNDFWHMLNGRYDGTIETYRNDYIKLLERTKNALPDVKLIIGEPFAVNRIKAVNDKWFPAFNEYRHAAREIAQRFNAVFVPYQSVFDKAEKSAPGSYWTGDGVHPTIAGARLMAEAWLNAVKG